MSTCAGEQLVELFHFTYVQYATTCLHATCPVSPCTNGSIDSASARLDTKSSSGTVRISSSKFATQCYGVRDNFSESDRHLGSLTLGLLTRNQVFESADSKSFIFEAISPIQATAPDQGFPLPLVPSVFRQFEERKERKVARLPSLS